jgi:hypothetical protein
VTPRRLFWGATLLVALIGLVLRLKGIHDPIFDHPGWRQGDTAAIARNFAQLQYNPLDPQTDYDGPPPNYVELELQIVPFLAATVYKLIGVHEIVGRLISLAFGVGTIVLIAPFGRWLFRSPLAGVAAAAVYAVLPGAWYYSRTFMPDTAMVFFLTAALYAGGRWIVDDEARSWRGWWPAALLLALAFLAKPVAVFGAIPLAAAAVARLGWRDALVWGWLAGGLLYTYVVVTVEQVDYYLYPLLPLGALVAGRLAAWTVARWGAQPQRRATLAGIGAFLWLLALVAGYREVAPYWHWSRINYARAKQLDATLAAGTLIVRGHYDPLHDRPQGLGGRPAALDPVRRGERDPQRGALLRRGRVRTSGANEPRAVLLAEPIPHPRSERGVAGVRDRSRQGTARRRAALERVSHPRDGGRVRALAARLEDRTRALSLDQSPASTVSRRPMNCCQP